MLSTLLFTIERGWNRLRANGKLLFLAVILFVFPLLFIVVLERFYAVAAANIQTAQQQRISAIQDSVAVVLESQPTAITPILQTVANQNSDITKFQVYETTAPDIVTVVASLAEAEIGATTTIDETLTTSRINPGESFSRELLTERGRVVQVTRLVPLAGTEQFIFSEHSFASFDVTLAQRKLDAYLLLSFIFVFMIALAYWINRQIDWEKKHNKLAASLEERDLFSNMIAHEFRTPLTAIKGYASFLQESDTMTKEEARFANTIRESAERLVLLVNDFLEVARIQSGRMKLEVELLDVRTAIQTVVDSLQGKASEKGLQLVYTPSLKEQRLSVDKNRFIQVLTNIISNSVKYTDTGTVEISCEETRTGVTIRVKDTGMGISAEDQQKLFAPFSRVGGVEHTGTTGTGLGMWITKQLIELLNGTIAVESIKGVGTHVVMQFKRTN